MSSYLSPSQWQPKSKTKTYPKVIATCFAAALLTGCFHSDDDDDDPVAPVNSTAPVIEEVTAKTQSATQVVAQVRVPDATAVKSLSTASNRAFSLDGILYAVKSLIPLAFAINEEDLETVPPEALDELNIDLLRYAPGSGYQVVAITDEQKQAAFSIALDTGAITVDLQALVDAGVFTEAVLDTELAIQISLTLDGIDTNPADGNDDVITLRAPLVAEALDISPISQVVINLIESANADIANLNISEVRNLVSSIFEVSVAGSSSVVDPRDLVAGLEEAGGAQLEEQFGGYLEEEPVANAIAAANGTFNVLIFEQALDAATPDAGFTFGSESHLVERASVTLNLDSGGNGTVRFNADDPNQVGGEAELQFGSVISLGAESFGGDEPSTGSAELHGNGNFLLAFPGSKEFDDSEEGVPPLWTVNDPLNLTLRSMGMAVGGQGRAGVGFGTENEFGDAGGAPDFDNHNAHHNYTFLMLALPQSSVSVSDFTRDMGVIFIDSAMESTNSSSFSLGYAVGDEVITATGTPGVFSGGSNSSFGIDRDQFGTTSFSETEVNTDTLTFGNFSNGTFEISSSEGGVTESSGFGIAAPNGDLIGAIQFEVECRNNETNVVRSDTSTLNCNDGETAIDADTVLFVGVPVAEIPALQQGDQYRFVTYQFDPQGGVLGCRGDLTVDDVVTTQVLTYSNQKCTNVKRVGVPDTSVSATSSVTPADLTLSYTFNGRVLEHVSNTEIRGFVSDDKNIIVTRYADANNPTYVGITIASRVVDSSAP